MARMILAAGVTTIGFLLAAWVFTPAAEQRPQPAQPTLELGLLSEQAPQQETADQLPSDVASILEARRQLGHVLEGTSLDRQGEDDDFMEALERVLNR